MIRSYNEYGGTLGRYIAPIRYNDHGGAMFRSNNVACDCSKLLGRVIFAFSPISRQFGDSEKQEKWEVFAGSGWAAPIIVLDYV